MSLKKLLGIFGRPDLLKRVPHVVLPSGNIAVTPLFFATGRRHGEERISSIIAYLTNSDCIVMNVTSAQANALAQLLSTQVRSA